MFGGSTKLGQHYYRASREEDRATSSDGYSHSVRSRPRSMK